MHFRKRSALFLIFFLSFQILSAQDEDDVKKYTNSKKEELSEDESDEMNGSRHVIKTSLLSNVYGSSILIYEYALTEKFSMGFSAGVNYSDYITSGVFMETKELPLTDNNKFYPINNLVSDESYIYKPGFLIRISAKIYTSPDYFQEGPYWSFEIGRNAFQSSFEYMQSISINPVLRYSETIKTTMSEFRVYYGRQGTFGSSSIFYDFHVSSGLAMLTKKFNYFDINDISLTNPQIEDNIRSLSPRFAVGLSIGYGF